MKYLLLMLLAFLGFAPLSSLQADEAKPVGPLSFASFFYLRCNTSGWDVNEVNRFKETQQPGVLELVFQVKDEWMTKSPDQCIVTETPDKNAWGAWQNYYSGMREYQVNAPYADYLKKSDKNFQLKFPQLGSYRARLDLADGSLSVIADSKASGQEAWVSYEWLGKDNFERLYRQGYSPFRSFGYIDESTGRYLWRFKGEQEISYTPECAFKDRVFLTHDNKLLAVTAQSGKTLWSLPIENPNQYPSYSLRCSPQSPYILVTAFLSDSQYLFMSVGRRDGKVLWSETGKQYPNILGLEGNRILLSEYNQNQMEVKARDGLTGAWLWQKQYPSGNLYFSYSSALGLYYQAYDTPKVGRLDSTTGDELWQKQSSGPEDYVSLSFEMNRLFLRSKYALASLEPDTGKVIWSETFPDQYPSYQIFRSGVVYVNRKISDTEYLHYGLNSWTGQKVWEKTLTWNMGYLQEDNEGSVWFVQQKKLLSIEPWTGDIRWEYILENQEPYLYIFSVAWNDKKGEIWINYGAPSKYPPMGLVSLDYQTGKKKWQRWFGEPVGFIKVSADRLFINVGYLNQGRAIIR